MPRPDFDPELAAVELDPDLAAAESRLLRLDESGEEPERAAATTLDAQALAGEGMRIDEGGEDVAVGDDGDEEHIFDGGLCAAIDAFNEAFNARDLDALLEVLAEDVEAPGLGEDLDNLPQAVEDLWERHPTGTLTRGLLDGQPLSILWEIGEDGRWWRVAPVLFDGAADGGELALVELVDDPDTAGAAAAEAPDDELEEGTRWEEWESGVPPDG